MQENKTIVANLDTLKEYFKNPKAVVKSLSVEQLKDSPRDARLINQTVTLVGLDDENETIGVIDNTGESDTIYFGAVLEILPADEKTAETEEINNSERTEKTIVSEEKPKTEETKTEEKTEAAAEFVKADNTETTVKTELTEKLKNEFKTGDQIEFLEDYVFFKKGEQHAILNVQPDGLLKIRNGQTGHVLIAPNLVKPVSKD